MSGHMNWNKATKRYEGELDGKKLCVDEKTFSAAYEAATNDPELCPQDDEQRVWGVLTWFSSWTDKNNKPVSGAYFEEQK